MKPELKQTTITFKGTGLLSVLAVLLWLGASAAQAGPLLQQYFPLPNGDQKMFTATVAGGQVQDTQTISDTTFNGNAMFAWNAVDTYYGGPASGLTVYCNYSGDQLLLSAGTEWGFIGSVNPPLVFLDEQTLAQGGSHTSQGTLTIAGTALTAQLTYAYTVTSAGTVSVPLGTFTNCKQVNATLTFASSEKTRIISARTMVLAPNVGIIEEPILGSNPGGSGKVQVGLYKLAQWVPAGYTNGPVTIITTNPLPAGTVNITYSNQFQAANGLPPYKWSLSTGKLPAGLTLNATSGLLSGKPTAAGTNSFGVRVTDLTGQSASNDFTLVIIDLFGPLAATYNGLITPSTAAAFTNSGSIKIVLSKTGSYAANLSLGGVTTAYQDQFDATGNASKTVVRPHLSTLQIALQLDLKGTNGTEQITGTVADPGFTSTVVADRTPTTSAVATGTYNCLIETIDTNNPAVPQGDGYATLVVSKTGLGTLAGTLADGTAVHGSVPVSKHGTWPWYNLLYANKGACIGWLTWDTNNLVWATVDWFKPTQHSGIYSNGFTTALALEGTKYLPPLQGGPVVTGNWQLTLSDGNLASNIYQTVYVNATGAITNKLTGFTLRVTPASGAFSGSFLNPANKRTIQFKGLLLQPPYNTGGGYFLGTSESGSVEMNPAP